MRVQDLQQFLGSFTEGSDAVKNAVIFVEINGKLHALDVWKCMRMFILS